MSWTVVLLLSAGAYAFKALGLLALSGREVPGSVLRFVGLLPPALLMALIVVQTLDGGEGRLWVDPPRIAGMLVAGVAVWRRAPFLLVVGSGAATAALLRVIG